MAFPHIAKILMNRTVQECDCNLLPKCPARSSKSNGVDAIADFSLSSRIHLENVWCILKSFSQDGFSDSRVVRKMRINDGEFPRYSIFICHHK